MSSDMIWHNSFSAQEDHLALLPPTVPIKVSEIVFSENVKVICSFSTYGEINTVPLFRRC